MMKLVKIAAWALGMLALASAPALGGRGARAGTPDDAARNRAIIARGLHAWADGTGSPYDLLAPDVRWTITGNSRGSRTYISKQDFMDNVIRPFNARMRDRLIPTVRRIYANGDAVVAHFDARGTARDGKPYVNSYAWILRMRDGQIVEAHAFFDALAFDDLWTRVEPAPQR